MGKKKVNICGFEPADPIFSRGPGRPMAERTVQLLEILMGANELPEKTVSVPLADDELGKRFHNFTHRCRSAAKRMGVKVSVSKSPMSSKHGIVRIVEEE